MPVPASLPGKQELVLHITNGGTPIPTDPRILNFRVFRAELLPDATANAGRELARRLASLPNDSLPALRAVPRSGSFDRPRAAPMTLGTTIPLAPHSSLRPNSFSGLKRFLRHRHLYPLSPHAAKRLLRCRRLDHCFTGDHPQPHGVIGYVALPYAQSGAHSSLMQSQCAGMSFHCWVGRLFHGSCTIPCPSDARMLRHRPLFLFTIFTEPSLSDSINQAWPA